MPKTRPYSREELRGLRRADLQRLCKTYDIKGANAKSEVLIDVLAKYFTSPAYLSSPCPERSRPRPQPPKVTVGSRNLNPIPRRAAATRSAAGPPTATQSNTAPTPHVPALVRSTESEAAKPVATGNGTAVSASSRENPRPVVENSRSVVENSRPVVESSHPVVENSRPVVGNSHPVVESSRPVNVTAEAAVTDSSALGPLQQEIRRLTEAMSTWQREQELAIDRLVDTRVAQRLDALFQQQMAAVERREAIVKQREDALEEAWRQFELKLRRSGLSGLAFHSEDESSLPVLGRGFVPSSGEKRRRDSNDKASPSKRARLQPVPSSPHTPPSTIESELGPSRFNVPRTPSPNLPVAAAYSILMDDESPSAMMPKHGPPHPPGNPPSPTLGRFDPTTVTNGPLPLTTPPERPRGEISPNTATHQPPSAAASTAPNAPAFQSAPRTVPKRTAPSPRREYMDVALNGLVNESQSAMATPNSRTLLGTERYRDTRFGDEPFVPWTSPTVDYDPHTPSM